MSPCVRPNSILFVPFAAQTSNLTPTLISSVPGIVPFHPIDTLKSRMQTRALESSSSSFQMLRTMIAKEGALSLYRGVASPMIGYGAINGSVFYARSLTRDSLLDYNARVNRGPLTFAQECLVGASAGFFSSFIRCPVERVKTYMQVRNSNKYLAPYRSSLKCGVALVKKHGVRTGLYAGLSATILREIPQYITYFLGYDYATKFLKSTNGLGVIPDRLTPAIAGGLAGSMVWVPPFYTIDVIKVRHGTRWERGILEKKEGCAKNGEEELWERDEERCVGQAV